MKTCYIKTLGCQMNVHDSERIAGILENEGYRMVENRDDADLVVINTCSVREKADQKFFSELGRLRKAKEARPDMKIAVAGCIAKQQGSAILSRFPYVDMVFGPQNLAQLPDILKISSRKTVVRVEDDPEYHLSTVPARRAGGVRAWVNIMYGCDNFCSYCIVPYTRGREKSRPPQEVIAEIRGLAAEGYSEVVLLGQNVNSYGKGLADKTDFPQLLHLAHEIDSIKRIRFATSHPKDMSPGLMEAFRDLPKLCKHIHLPVQAGSNRVLERMNRRYTADDYIEKTMRLREMVPDIAITTDMIVGFPGEEREDFEATVALVRTVEYDGIFGFKYSKRPHTRASGFEDQVSEEEKSDRLNNLLTLQDEICGRKNRALVGTAQEVLVEGRGDDGAGRWTGRTSTNRIVNFDSDADNAGRLIPVIITEGFQHSLTGRAA
ncbi:MAG: tRNA (N6-isopentenyl adenosine(37)-C2)-methylthiotransferase MiaB [Nitrospirae bacterium]|nr:tRNA (N6-isopentenyl adenosine(37)-C2)-methylthiotransferase MiaB [Nitrospirota bacterium]